MKKLFLGLAIVACAVLTSCSGNSYASLRNEEDKLIANYVSRNNLHVLTDEPAVDYQWAENDYLLVPGYDDLYFHLTKRGDSITIDENGDTIHIDEVAKLETIVMRYKKFALTENADTLSYWTTLDQAYPMEFQYMNTTQCEAVGWHIAVKYMKYTNAECQIICPSKLGFSTDANTVTPYVYILKMKINR